MLGQVVPMSIILFRMAITVLTILFGLVGMAVQLTYSNAGTPMVFWVKSGEQFALHLLDIDKGLLVRLLPSPPYRVLNAPQLTRDGERTLFEVERDGERALFLLDQYGNVRYEQARSIGIRHPIWSPDGQEIAYWATTDGFWRFYHMSQDGGQPELLSDTVGLVPYTYPLWSPDGRYILYRIWVAERGSSIYLLDTHSGQTRLPGEALSAAGDLIWSPDGRWLAYRSERSRNGEIHVLEIETGVEYNLTQHPATDFQPDWSPDGGQLVFVSNRAGQGEIYRMQADGTRVTQLTSGGGWRPDWSPAGDQIAFISRRSGEDWLYSIRPDGGGLHMIAHLHPGMVFLGWLGEMPRN